MKEITFESQEGFGAYYKAKQWLKDNGYAWGSMQRDDPIGVMKGDYDIAKWRNLSIEDRKSLDGVILGAKRSGPVTIRLYESPKEAGY